VRPGGDEELARAVATRAVAPGETLAVDVAARAPEAGVHVWAVTLELAADQDASGTRDSLRARTGPGPLELTEIQFHPARGEGEWVEAHNRSGLTVELAGWTLGDRGGTLG